MFDVTEVRNAFSRAAGDYDSYAQLQKHVRSLCIALARNLWGENTKILDAGCGTGALFSEAPWRMTGLDVSAGMCKLATQKDRPVVCADAAAIPFSDAYFDGVSSSLMLQWAANPAGVFSELFRVLKPGGHVVLATLAEGTLLELKTAFSTLDSAPHVSEFLPAHEILAHAENAGFTLASARQHAITEHYPDTVSLMRSIKVIGAANKHPGRKRGLATSRQFARLEQSYREFTTPQGLPATWQVLTLVLQKA